MEFRPPDATCNPYLAIAAQLMAGIDGVRRRIDPTELGFGPFDEDVFSWSAEKRAHDQGPADLARRRPSTPSSATTSSSWRAASSAARCSQRWVKRKRSEERPVSDRPHPYEIELYYDL